MLATAETCGPCDAAIFEYGYDGAQVRTDAIDRVFAERSMGEWVPGQHCPNTYLNGLPHDERTRVGAEIAQAMQNMRALAAVGGAL
jgi:hypothetical protein